MPESRAFTIADAVAPAVPFVHVVIPGEPFASPRPRATLMPLVSTGEALARARSARSLRDLMALFRPRLYVKQDRKWDARVGLELLRARRVVYGAAPIAGVGQPIEVFLLFVFGLAKSHHRKRSPPPRSWHCQGGGRGGGGDFDNLAKPICDAASGVLWPDDCQVARATIEKVIGAQGEEPRIELLARRLPDSPEEALFSAVLAGRAWCAAPSARLQTEGISDGVFKGREQFPAVQW